MLEEENRPRKRHVRKDHWATMERQGWQLSCKFWNSHDWCHHQKSEDARNDYSIKPFEEGQRALQLDWLKTPTSKTGSYASVLLSHIFCDIFPTLRILSPCYGFPKHGPMSHLYNTTSLLDPFFQYDCIMVTFNCHFARI